MVGREAGKRDQVSMKGTRKPRPREGEKRNKDGKEAECNDGGEGREESVNT